MIRLLMASLQLKFRSRLRPRRLPSLAGVMLTISYSLNRCMLLQAPSNTETYVLKAKLAVLLQANR
jgi:hypothetical protein